MRRAAHRSARSTVRASARTRGSPSGMPRAALTGILPENVPNGVGGALLIRLADRGDLAIQSNLVVRAGFASSLDAKQEAIAEMLRARFSSAALDAPALKTIAEESGEDENRLRAIAHYLERSAELVAAPLASFPYGDYMYFSGNLYSAEFVFCFVILS